MLPQKDILASASARQTGDGISVPGSADRPIYRSRTISAGRRAASWTIRPGCWRCCAGRPS